MNTLNRRTFLKTGGYLTIGFTLWGCNAPGRPAFIIEPGHGADAIDAWLQLSADGTIRILTGKIELGQGLKIVMQQVAGEELNTHPNNIEVIMADTGMTQNEGYTAGSRTAEKSAMTVRRAAAAARSHILQLAADHWSVAPDALTLRDGLISRSGATESLDFSTLLKDHTSFGTIPEQVSLKPKDEYEWIGKPLPHPDLEKIVRGEALFIQDLRFEHMVHARVLHPPIHGSQLIGLGKAIEEMPGVFKNGSGRLFCCSHCQ